MAGGGQIPLTSLTKAHAVLELNIAVQSIIKALANFNGFYTWPGVLNSSYISYNSSTRIIFEVSCTKHK